MKKYAAVFVFVVMCISFAYASDLGYVKQTDIVTFIDYSPIQSYNYKGNTFVVAEDLSEYGFDVVWNADERALFITRPEKNFTPYAADFINEKREDVTFKDLFAVYPTDIKTYINNNLSESYNINGITVVSVDAVGEYGGGIVKYDDTSRRLDVCIIDKEIENCEEKAEEDENSKTLKKGFFDGDGNLLYGIEKYEGKSRYGTSEQCIYGDLQNEKTVKIYNSYIYSNIKKYEYRNVENYRADICSDDKDNPSYSMYFGEKSTVYIEEDDAFKYKMRVRSAKAEDGSEMRYLPETGKIYLFSEKEDFPYGEGVSAVYDDNGNEIYNSDTYPRKFNGQLFKNGYPVYKGEILLDRFEVCIGGNINYDTKRITALYAPGYTDADGVVYYYSDEQGNNERDDSVLYRGNVVNGAMHGNGTMYYINYGLPEQYLKKGREILVYGEGRTPGVIYAEDESVMYIGEFKDGRMNGRGKMYRNGALTSDGEWKNGERDGFMTEYNSYVDEIYLAFEGNYKNGRKNGEGIEYGERGNPQFEGMYKRFVGTFENGEWKSGDWYELKYNAEKNCHDIYLYEKVGQ